jgi:hypothetical protein
VFLGEGGKLLDGHRVHSGGSLIRLDLFPGRLQVLRRQHPLQQIVVQGWLRGLTPRVGSPGRVHHLLRVAHGSSLFRDVRPFTARTGFDRTATMASADFCFLPPDVSARKAGRGALGAGGLSTPFGMVRSPAPIATSPSPRGKQISPDKSVSFPCTAASFTISPEPEGFAIGCWLAQETWPRMTFLFVGSQVCRGLPPDAPSRRRPCLRLVVATEFIDVGSPTGDLHPINSRPCRAYTHTCTGRSASRLAGEVHQRWPSSRLESR